MAQRAIELDPMLATAYAALGNIQFYYEWDFAAADRSFRKALEVGPSNSFARQRFAMFLAATGKVDEGLKVAVESRTMSRSIRAGRTRSASSITTEGITMRPSPRCGMPSNCHPRSPSRTLAWAGCSPPAAV
jgi:tetratricopeptide (TPR) repeat protein